MAAVTVTNGIATLTNADDYVAGVGLLAGLVFVTSGASSATQINANGTSGVPIYKDTPTSTATTWFAPWGEPILVNDLYFKTKGNNITAVYAVFQRLGADVAGRVSAF